MDRSKPPIGAWSTGGNLNTARNNAAGFGTQVAGITAGGGTPSATANVESYDGTSWTEVNNLNTARFQKVLVQELLQLV